MQLSLMSNPVSVANAAVPGSGAPPGLGPPDLSDLEGLLVGAGQLVRRGEAARLSAVIPSAAGATEWRIEALLATFAELRLVGEAVATVGGLAGVRTAFTPLLAPLANAWTKGAVKAPPVDFRLGGAKLRMWAIAAGHTEGVNYQFGLAEHDKTMWRRLELAMREVGLAPALVGPRAGGPALRVTGRRRLLHLAELIGPAPAGADWPAP